MPSPFDLALHDTTESYFIQFYHIDLEMATDGAHYIVMLRDDEYD